MSENSEKEDRKEKRIKKEQSNQSGGSKVIKVVALRNRFFYMFYRNTSLVLLTSLIGFVTSCFFLITFIRQPVAPQYIPLNPDGTYIKLLDVSEPKADLEVNNFSTAALKKLYKFDYINYPEQLMEAATYFIPEGWNEYLTSYTKSGSLSYVKENHCVVSIKILEAPIINRKGLNRSNGLYEWELQTKVEVSYYGYDSKNRNPLNKVDELYALVRVSRNSIINNPDGLGISKLVFTDKLPTN